MTRSGWIIVGVTVILIFFIFGAGAAAIVAIHEQSEKNAQESYDQDVRTWKEQLDGCVRGKLQARLSRQGWELAARRAEVIDPNATPEGLPRAYKAIAKGFNPLTDDLDCLVAFPPPPVPNGATPDPAMQKIADAAELQDRRDAAMEDRIRALKLGAPPQDTP